MSLPDFAAATDTTSAIIDGASAIVAVVAAAIAGLSAKDSRLAAREARAPVLITTEPPKVTDDGAGKRVSFTARNEGKGVARLVAYAVRDAIVNPQRSARHELLANPKARDVAAQIIPLESYYAFSLMTEADWFRDVIDQSRKWVVEIEYTDVPATRLFWSRFEVGRSDADGTAVVVDQIQQSRRL